MSWTKSVYSTMATEIGYNDDTKEMMVRWTNGRVSAYAGVSEDLADQVANAPSVGTMLNNEIKPNFAHRYV